MQHNYQSILKLEIELRQLEEAQVPSRPCKYTKKTFTLFYLIQVLIFNNMFNELKINAICTFSCKLEGLS